MNKQRRGTDTVIRERITILKKKGYRGFRLTDKKKTLENSIELGARSKTGLKLIAIGDTLEEAYESLIARIDVTLDG